MAVGHSHGCVVLNNGRLKCWGANDAGQLGYGDTKNRGDAPQEMGANLSFVDIGSGYGTYDASVVSRARLMTGGGYRLLASGQTLEGSFSAVWTATIATKYMYSFCIIFRDLQDYQNGFPIFAIFQFLCTVFSKFHKIFPIFVEICRFRSDFDF